MDQGLAGVHGGQLTGPGGGFRQAPSGYFTEQYL
jgi:hypothetical protein